MLQVALGILATLVSFGVGAAGVVVAVYASLNGWPPSVVSGMVWMAVLGGFVSFCFAMCTFKAAGPHQCSCVTNESSDEDETGE